LIETFAVIAKLCLMASGYDKPELIYNYQRECQIELVQCIGKAKYFEYPKNRHYSLAKCIMERKKRYRLP
jgi:hypothetical protein